MNEIQNTTGAAADDFDDVEAHGMREVVVGLSAAAVLTGGAAAVLSSQAADSGKGTIHATQALDATELRATDDASAKTRDAAGPASITGSDGAGSITTAGVDAKVDAVRGTTDAADDLVSPNRTFLQRVDDRVDGIVDDGRAVRDNAVRSAGAIADDTRTAVKEQVRQAGATVNEAPQAVRSAVSEATGTSVTVPSVGEIKQTSRQAVDATLVVTGDTVRTVAGGLASAIARVQPAVDGDVDLRDAGGWVTVSVGGEEVARAEVKDGQASLSWQAPSADLPVTFTYTGGDILQAPSVTL